MPLLLRSLRDAFRRSFLVVSSGALATLSGLLTQAAPCVYALSFGGQAFPAAGGTGNARSVAELHTILANGGVAKGKRFMANRRVAIPDDTGVPRYILSVIEDVTERRRAELELVEAKDRLTLATRAGCP